jgi:hypothetical protein
VKSYSLARVLYLKQTMYRIIRSRNVLNICRIAYITCMQLITNEYYLQQAYHHLLAFCIPFPPDYMKVISSTGRGALALFCASHESSFKVPSDCYTMAVHRVLGFTAESASHIRKRPRCNEAVKHPQSLVGLEFSRRHRAPLCLVSAPQLLCLWTTFHGARALDTSLSPTIGLLTCLKSSCLKRWLLRRGTCGWRSTVCGSEFLEIDMGIWFG